MADVPLLTYHGRPGAMHATILKSKHTISSLAKATDYSKAHISRIFRLLDGPSDDCLAKLAKALRMRKADLAGRLRPTRREESQAARRLAEAAP